MTIQLGNRIPSVTCLAQFLYIHMQTDLSPVAITPLDLAESSRFRRLRRKLLTFNNILVLTQLNRLILCLRERYL